MEAKLFKEQGIRTTLRYVAVAPEKWMTFNDQLNTYLINEDQPMKSAILLEEDEAPILECILEDSFMLITTKRLISRLFGKYDELLLKEIVGFTNEYVEENFSKIEGKPPKINMVVVKGENDKKLTYKIDSYYPAYFAQILISNLSNYLRSGIWAFNPKKVYKE